MKTSTVNLVKLEPSEGMHLRNKNTGEVRLNIFYCDPMTSCQKPHVENNHEFIYENFVNSISETNDIFPYLINIDSGFGFYEKNVWRRKRGAAQKAAEARGRGHGAGR